MSEVEWKERPAQTGLALADSRSSGMHCLFSVQSFYLSRIYDVRVSKGYLELSLRVLRVNVSCTASVQSRLRESLSLLDVSIGCSAIAMLLNLVSDLLGCVPSGQSWLLGSDNLRESPKIRPNHDELILITIQDMTQMYSPNDVAIWSNTG